MYGSWDMVRDGYNYFSFWAIFCPFVPLTAQKIKIKNKKTKKTPGDIIILHMCTKDYDQITYGSSDMVHDRCNCYFSYWAIFWPFTPPPPNSRNKSTFWKNEKKPWTYYYFTYVYQKLWSDDVRFLRYSAWRIWLFFILDHFCLFTSPPNPPPPNNSPKNQNFEKMKILFGDIILLHLCTNNYDQMMYGSWDMVGNRRTDGQTDRWTENVTYRGGCPT